MQPNRIWPAKVTRAMLLCTSSLLLVACTRTCVGTPELGSKQRPIRFYLNSWAGERESVAVFSVLTACLERQAGYRVRFEVAASERAVASALGRGDAQFGTLSAFGFVEAAERHGVQSLLVVSQRGAPSTRSVLIGKASRWNASLQSLGLSLTPSGLRAEEALQPLSGKRFAYTSPDSDLGFFVPRSLLLQRGVFPDEVVFAGSSELVMQAVERDLVMAGAVAETHLERRWPQSGPFQVGTLFDDFVVLGLSSGLPGKVVAVRRDTPARLQEALVAGLQACAAREAGAETGLVFEGDGFQTSHERMFEFVRDLQGFQQDHLRVLTLQDAQEP
ncbi:MAG: PhnD/SsuA/transferrin family substrate-binding protein [Silvanigrellales bacterium]|jgi:ABC-type phosphate/phosphonate transport system substrate-binding protein|nr:PhnD/SsuA/transferrin family substrate-binding protein [Silvanigrellales bacterium]